MLCLWNLGCGNLLRLHRRGKLCLWCLQPRACAEGSGDEILEEVWLRQLRSLDAASGLAKLPCL